MTLLRSIDSYAPAINIPDFLRLSTEYKVAFRLIYCCDLRISEARKLRWSDVDLEQRAIRILRFKGHKDRLVYMAEDLTELIQLYRETMKEHYHCSSEWVFPARGPGKCLTNGTLDTRCRKIKALIQSNLLIVISRERTIANLKNSLDWRKKNQ